MKLAYPDISEVLRWDQPQIPSLVIESQPLFRKFIRDLWLSSENFSTDVVLSKHDKPIEFSKNAEIISEFINFNINQKPLINKICAAMEQKALSSDNFFETKKLLAEIEKSVSEWAFDFSCNVTATKITVPNVLKAVGIELCDDYVGEEGDAERLIDYMELVREFDRDKVFITVNMRSWFSDKTMKNFLSTALSHEYKVLMIDAAAHTLLKEEKRLTVDADLCEF